MAEVIQIIQRFSNCLLEIKIDRITIYLWCFHINKNRIRIKFLKRFDLRFIKFTNTDQPLKILESVRIIAIALESTNNMNVMVCTIFFNTDTDRLIIRIFQFLKDRIPLKDTDRNGFFNGVFSMLCII